MSAEPLLSIVIATRNRQKYAKSSVRSLCTSISRPDVEFVVQDNSDDGSLGDYLDNEIGDPRIQYRYVSSTLNMTQNYDVAMSHAIGRYVCMIGDDDGINPEIVDAALWAEQYDVDSLKAQAVASYFWPGFRSHYYRGKHAGKIYVNSFGGGFAQLDLKKGMDNCVSHAAFGIEKWDIPKVYLGLIRRDRLNEIKVRTGYFFDGISPDMYGAVSAAHICRRSFVIDYPLILGGSSPVSNAGLSAQRKHKGTFEASAHMRNYSVDDWPAGLPRYWANETAYSSAALCALRRLGRNDLIRAFNYPLLHAKCLLSHPDYSSETVRSFRAAHEVMGVSSFSAWARFVVSLAREVIGQSAQTIRRLSSPGPSGGADVCRDLLDVEQAVIGLRSYLTAKEVSFTGYAALAGMPIGAQASRT